MYQLPKISSQSSNNDSTLERVYQQRFRIGENVLYQIHKKALSNYLHSGNIDQNIVQLNLLKMSQLKPKDLSILNNIYSNSESNRLEQMQADKILSKIQTEQKQKTISIYSRNSNALSQEEIEFQQVEEYLKQCLKSKINTSKVFNGTYLVDPSLNDLKKQNIENMKGKKSLVSLFNTEPKKRLNKKTSILKRQSSILNPQQCLKPSMQSIEIEDIAQLMSSKIIDSRTNLDQLIERYKQPTLTENQELFFHLLQTCNYEVLHKLIKEGYFSKQTINSQDQKGFYGVHIAIKKQNPKILKLLLKYGANIRVLTKSGKNCKELSELYQNIEVQNIIDIYWKL